MRFEVCRHMCWEFKILFLMASPFIYKEIEVDLVFSRALPMRNTHLSWIVNGLLKIKKAIELILVWLPSNSKYLSLFLFLLYSCHFWFPFLTIYLLSEPQKYSHSFSLDFNIFLCQPTPIKLGNQPVWYSFRIEFNVW